MEENVGVIGELQMVIFNLGHEKYGIDISKVREIIIMQDITKVPHTQEFIEGIINLRGIVVPVFNIKRKFNLAESQSSQATRIIVVDVAGNTVGMIVDGVHEVYTIPCSIIEKPPEQLLSGINQQYMIGIAKMSEQLVIILDIEKVINS